MSSVPSVSSIAASIYGTNTAAASVTSSDWMDPSATGVSSVSSSSTTPNADAYLAADSALSTALSDSLSNLVQGQATLAGQAALDRVNAAIKQKQASTASSSSTGTATKFNGYTAVQNLMASLDNITINHGSAPALGVSSTQAANGYAAVQNLMKAFDNITINGGANAAGPSASPTGQSLLQSLDAIMATPVKVTA
jgi:hypothetical protein